MTRNHRPETSALVLVGDDHAYWHHYLRSLRSSRQVGLAVRTADPELTRTVLTEVGLPVTVGAGPGESTPCPGGLAAELGRLHDDGDLGRIADLEAQLRGVTARQVCRPGEWIVGVGGGVALGLARAVADGRPFHAVESLADPSLVDLAQQANSLYVVTDSADPAQLARLQRDVNAHATHELLPGVRGCPLGVLHGRDFAAMTFLDAKQRRPAPPVSEPFPDILIDSTVSDAPAQPAADLVTAPYQQVSREMIERHEHIRLLAITSHGMSDLIHLNDDYLCGRSPYLSSAELAGAKLPSCMMDEGPHCFFKPNGRPLRVHQIPAEHVFVNSCGSLSFEEGDFDSLFTIWYSAMDGRARSFVGTIRWKEGHGLEGLLYRHLLRTGRTLGAAVGVLNRVLPGHQLEDGEVYFLLGDPEERLLPRRAPTAVPELRRGRNLVHLSGGFAQLIVTSPDLAHAIRETGPHVNTTGGPALYTSTLPADTGPTTHVLLFTGEHIDRELAVDAGDFRPEHATMLAVSEALDQTLNPVLGMHGLYPDPVRQGGRKNLENRLLQLSRLYKARFTEPAAAARLERSTRNLLRELDRTDEQIARWLQDRIRTTSYRFSENYQDNFLLAGAESESHCYQCGRTLVRRELRHILRPAVRRIEFICAACGSIADTPDPTLTLQMHLPDRLRRGEKTSVSVRLDNHSDHERRGYCLIAVRKSTHVGIEQPDTVQAVTVDAGATTEVTFDLVVGDTTAVHQYDLQAAFVSMTKIFLGHRGFWITA